MTLNIKTKQLELLLNDFELLSETAIRQMEIAHELLYDNTKKELHQEAKANELILDRLEIKVREEVVFTIFQFNPIASDLRKIVTYQDVTTNLERVGDMLLKTIRFIREIDFKAPEFTIVYQKIDEMMKYASAMLRDAVNSFLKEDSKLAYQVIKEDDKVDNLFREIAKELQEAFANKHLTKKQVESIINANAIAYNLERIGDSATNVAEAAIYLTDGQDIRHFDKLNK
jgi:phosphate transport system protein